MALWAGADLIDMECVQFHPTGMVWPPSVRGLLVTEGVRGDGGVLRNKEGERFMFNYIPDMFRAETADTEEEADRWYEDHSAGRRPPELLPRDEVARAINTEVKAGRGSPHGGVFLDIASRRTAEYISRRLPSMYHQFKELADVDITTEADGGRPDLPLHHGRGPGRRRHRGGHRPGPLRRRRGGRRVCTAPTGWAATRSRTCSSSAGGPGMGAAEYAKGRTRCPVGRPGRGRRGGRRGAGPRSSARRGENPYDVHHDLQETMQSLVGIIRTGAELKEALGRLEELEERAANVSHQRRAPLQPRLEPRHRPPPC